MITVDLDLTPPGLLSTTLDQYISHGVCPASCDAAPAFFSDVKLRVLLPGGFEVYWTGRVIRLMGPQAFLVELTPVPSIPWLKTLLAFDKPQAPDRKSGGSKEFSVLVEEHTEDEVSTSPELGGASDSSSLADSEASESGFLNPQAEHTSPELLFSPLAESHRSGEWSKESSTTGTAWANDWSQRTGSGAAAFQSSGSWPVGLILENSSEFAAPEKTGPAFSSTPGTGPTFVAPSTAAPRTQPRDTPRPGGKPPPGQNDSPELRAKIASLTLDEKRHVARKGGRGARKALINDPEKALHTMVILNPEIGLDELEEYTMLPGLAPEAIRHIVQNRSWMNSRTVVFNLVRNPATPLEIAAALCQKLGPTEWKLLVSALDVRTPVAAVARKLLLKNSI